MKIDSDKLIEILKEKWSDKNCPMCDKNKSGWIISEKIYKIKEYNEDNYLLCDTSSVMPIIPIICSNCGNTILINPLALNLI